jgi:hypothetical protein
MPDQKDLSNLKISQVVRDLSQGENGPIIEIHYVDEDGETVRVYLDPPEQKE